VFVILPPTEATDVVWCLWCVYYPYFFWRSRGNWESMSWLKLEWNIWWSVTNIAIIFKGSQILLLYTLTDCVKTNSLNLWGLLLTDLCKVWVCNHWTLQYSSSCGWTTRAHNLVVCNFWVIQTISFRKTVPHVLLSI